jgi:hypothetical protein
VVITAYSGGLMNVPGWGPLVIDLAGLDLSALQVGILADHDASLNGIIGHGEAVVRDGKLLVAGTLAGTDAARQVIALAKTGFAFQASVGVTPKETERVEAFGTPVDHSADSTEKLPEVLAKTSPDRVHGAQGVVIRSRPLYGN